MSKDEYSLAEIVARDADSARYDNISRSFRPQKTLDFRYQYNSLYSSPLHVSRHVAWQLVEGTIDKLNNGAQYIDINLFTYSDGLGSSGGVMESETLQ